MEKGGLSAVFHGNRAWEAFRRGEKIGRRSKDARPIPVKMDKLP